MALDPLPQVPAIAGERSLLVPPGCSIRLRLARSPGATELRFEMQRLGVPSDLEQRFNTCVSSLGVDDDDICTASLEAIDLEGPVVSHTIPPRDSHADS